MPTEIVQRIFTMFRHLFYLRNARVINAVRETDYLTVQIEIKHVAKIIRLHIGVENADECQAGPLMSQHNA